MTALERFLEEAEARVKELKALDWDFSDIGRVQYAALYDLPRALAVIRVLKERLEEARYVSRDSRVIEVLVEALRRAESIARGEEQP